MTINRHARVLLVEDDDGDALLVREGFREAGDDVDLVRVHDGAAALDHLAHVKSGRLPPPDLIVLDLNLPGIDGVQVLERIKRDPMLATTPVTILTTSDDARHVEAVYRAHGNAYITKPVDLTTFLARIGELRRFWVDTVVLPVQD